MTYRFTGGMVDSLFCAVPDWKGGPLPYIWLTHKLSASAADQYPWHVHSQPTAGGHKYWLAGTDANGCNHYVSDHIDYEQFCMSGQSEVDADA